MELIAITALCISLSFLLTPCASRQIQVQPSHDQALNLRVGFLIPPRKLRLIEEAATTKVDGGKELLSCGASAGKHHKKAGTTRARGGTRQEPAEGGTEASQLFTMDYSHVRRRRPVNNKSLPVSP
ncbi:protein GOLVEN 6 isoform X2 [Rhododendron vialii]|uniref:protein GOLVEN 6 isoform X2 n=1 Tax=Rhododendron vialii TaxID=182163 RepID=UPI00265E6F32|nr:protein GOLVEN 6 isoform X2 [Rhododendron vialii]